MGAETKIAWTDATLNPWMGCQRVSPGCEKCYAEALVTTRMRLPVWGPAKTTERKRTAAATWNQARAWNRKAVAEGRRVRVFCASLADVFEDHPQVAPWRADLFALIEATPALDWQLLTKRPQNIRRMLPPAWLDEPRPNVWLGTTVEDQKRADERIPALLDAPAAVRFLSCEPLLEPLNLRPWIFVECARGCGWMDGTPLREAPNGCRQCGSGGGETIDWVIVGGESGHGARPLNIGWARELVAQCQGARVPVFVKQLGPTAYEQAESIEPGYGGPNADLLPVMSRPRPPQMAGWTRVTTAERTVYTRHLRLRDAKGGDMAEWPDDLRVREFPRAIEAA